MPENTDAENKALANEKEQMEKKFIEERKRQLGQYYLQDLYPKWEQKNTWFKNIDSGDKHDFTSSGKTTLSGEAGHLQPFGEGSYDVMRDNNRLMTFHVSKDQVVTPTFYEHKDTVKAMQEVVRAYKMLGRDSLTLDYAGLDYSKRSDVAHKLDDKQLLKLLEMAKNEKVAITFGKELNSYLLAMKDDKLRDKINLAMRETHGSNAESTRLQANADYTVMARDVDTKVQALASAVQALQKDGKPDVTDAKMSVVEAARVGLESELKELDKHMASRKLTKLDATPDETKAGAEKRGQQEKFLENMHGRLEKMQSVLAGMQPILEEAAKEPKFKDKVAGLNETIAGANEKTGKMMEQVEAAHAKPGRLVIAQAAEKLGEKIDVLAQALNELEGNKDPAAKVEKEKKVDGAKDALNAIGEMFAGKAAGTYTLDDLTAEEREKLLKLTAELLKQLAGLQKNVGSSANMSDQLKQGVCGVLDSVQGIAEKTVEKVKQTATPTPDREEGVSPRMGR